MTVGIRLQVQMRRVRALLCVNPANADAPCVRPEFSVHGPHHAAVDLEQHLEVHYCLGQVKAQ
jgi:hypothetical protein